MRGRWRWRIFLGLSVTGGLSLVVFLFLYLRLRSEPALYRAAAVVDPKEEARGYAACEQAFRRARRDLESVGSFSLVLTLKDINAALAKSFEEGDLPECLGIPEEVRQVRVAARREWLVVMGKVETSLGPMVASAYLRPVRGSGGALRLKVARLRLGTLDVKRRWARRLVREIENRPLLLDLDSQWRLRITRLELHEGNVVVSGRRERR